MQAVIQYSDQLGGVLEVHVYAGADGQFTMVEDDGNSLDYLKGDATRNTHFQWDDSSRTLSWTVDAGNFHGSAQDFDTVQAVLLEDGKPAPQRASSMPLKQKGSVSF